MARRAAAVFAAGLLLAICAGASPSSAGNRPPTVIGCAVGYYGGWQFHRHPHHCTEYRGGSRAHANELAMHRISWHHWGQRRVRGKGRWFYINMGVRRSGPVKLLAYRRVFACGRRVYTRLRTRSIIRGLPDSVLRFHLPRCS